MTVAAEPSPAAASNASTGHGGNAIALALRFAIRELRGGLRGFYVFLICIALGVAAIAGVNSVARSITQGIVEEGQAILGGDVSIALEQQQLTPEQADFISDWGTVSRSAKLRAMARLFDGSDQTLIELKAVDNIYPLYGSLELTDRRVEPGTIADDVVFVEGLLAERLGVAAGDLLTIGSGTFSIAGVISSEPDRLGENFGFGPRVLMTLQGLERAELVRPGSIVTNLWKIRFDDSSADQVSAFLDEAESRFPETGWRLRSRENAAPALSRNIGRFSDFLTLVGLTALIVGGVGVANAVRAYLENKRPVIATLKSLGAAGDIVFLTYLFQILMIAFIGIAIGIVIGGLMPFAAGWALQGILPVPQSTGLQWAPLILGALYGLLTAIAFAIWPLGRAREIQATDLFRGHSDARTNILPRPVYIVALTACVLALVALAIFMSENRYVAAVFVGAIAFSFVLLRIVALAIQKVAAALPHPRSTPLRMAIGNIYRPGSLTPSVVLSLGLGLALLVALALIDGNLRRQVSGNLPERAPDFFFVDIQNDQKEPFEKLLSELALDGKIFSVPMLRGRIISLKGIPSGEYPVGSEGGWVLRGDRGLTYATNIPENSTLSKGEWWPADYTGEPLVSFSAEEAGELDLDIGDEIRVNVLGRNITAKIASLRNVEWESLAINFVMVFSPNTFAGAPHSHIATLTLDEDQSTEPVDERDGRIVRAVADAYPTVTSVRVREALETVNRLISQLATAIRAAASVALIASVLVLGGALAAGNRARVHDAVVLKTLGATRGKLTRTFIYEYLMLGAATAVFALVAGGAAAWFVIARIMDFPYLFLPSVAVATVLIALLTTVGFGLIGTWRILGQKAAPVLREL